MEADLLLDYDEDVKKVEEEEKTQFLRGILEQCFINSSDIFNQIENIWSINDSIILNAHQRVQLRSLLSTYNLQIIDDRDGNLKIYLENQVIGEWKKSTFKLKRDLKAIDPKKRFYLEMHIECWSVFEQEEDNTPEQETNS